MFSNIKTSKANKEIISKLTNKLSLGAENVIARIAFTHSIAMERQLDLAHMQDSGGKEYSFKVLFGDHSDHYIALICVHYGLYKTDKDIPRYIKMHIDDGLESLNSDFGTTLGVESIISAIDRGLQFVIE